MTKKYDQNVGCVIRYCKLATNSHIYANVSHRLKLINEQRNMTKFLVVL